jgi:hypothetical protein
VKGSWSDCDPKTNTRSRILTLKKGDQNTCEQTKTIQKKCKKGNVPIFAIFTCSSFSECLYEPYFGHVSYKHIIHDLSTYVNGTDIEAVLLWLIA